MEQILAPAILNPKNQRCQLPFRESLGSETPFLHRETGITVRPKVQGTGGYEQPSNQNSAHGNPSGSANPEH